MARSKHRAPLVNPGIDYEEIVVFREHMFIDKMHASSLWIEADFVTPFNKTAVLGISSKRFSRTELSWIRKYRLFTLGSSRLVQRIMVLTDMEPKKMFCGKVPSAFRTPIGVGLCIVDFEFLKCRKD
jgi:hypothetical protein